MLTNGHRDAEVVDGPPRQNRKPATYRCPLCGRYLPALSEHLLLMPEGDPTRRRHAHTQCVIDARRQGRLSTRDEFEGRNPKRRKRRVPGLGSSCRTAPRAPTHSDVDPELSWPAKLRDQRRYWGGGHPGGAGRAESRHAALAALGLRPLELVAGREPALPPRVDDTLGVAWRRRVGSPSGIRSRCSLSAGK